MFLEILSNSPKDLDEGKYYALINRATGSGDGCTTIGRFLDLFEKDKIKLVKDYLDKEEDLIPNAAFIEGSFFPNNPKFANVSTAPLVRKKYIDLGYSDDSTNNLSLEDIYVGASQQRLYLFSKKLNSELYCSSLNALNQKAAPLILRLLRDISEAHYSLFSQSCMGEN